MRRSVVRRATPSGYATAAILLSVAVSACGLIGKTGEGPLTTETRPVTGFTRVDVSNGIGVTVRFGQTTSVDVSAQANILPIIATTVEGETLKIRSTEGFTTSAGVGVTVVMPALSGITLSGGSLGVIESFNADRLEITQDGGSVLTATGTSTTVTLTASGGAAAHLDALAAETVNVQVSGGANATVRASREVAGSASGGAHVTVLGDGTLNVETSGGGSVTRG
jgi:hypothetical protein